MFPSFKPLSSVFVVLYSLSLMAMPDMNAAALKNFTKFSKSRINTLPPIDPVYRVAQLPPIDPVFAFSISEKALVFTLVKNFMVLQGDDANETAISKIKRKQYIPVPA